MTNNYTKTKTTTLAIVLAASFLASSTTTATATELPTGTQPDITENILAPLTGESQVILTVLSSGTNEEFGREGFKATTQTEIDTEKNKKAEEERLKALSDAQAAADEEASVRATNAGTSSGSNKKTVNTAKVAPGQVVPADGIIAAAQQWVGVVPYGYGNHPSDSFMCDGYVQYVFKQNGISLPRGADSQARKGTVIAWEDGKAGDLVWWPGQHIAIYDGNGGYYHSPTWGRYVTHAKKVTWGNPVIVRL